MTVTEVEAYDVSRLPAVRGADSLVRPAADTGAIKASFRAYSELCEELLDQSDYQRIGSKDFRKKSGWRKLAVAFGVSVEIVSETETRDERGRIQRCKTIVRAIAPNGRYQDGVGVCDVRERCCPAAEGLACGDKRQYHRHCEVGCPGWIHYSGAEHDIVATAATRATNRAQADLFGMGEVSAEEITDSGRGEHEDHAPQVPLWQQLGYADGDELRAVNDGLLDLMKQVPEDRRAQVGEAFDGLGYPQGKRFPVAKEHVDGLRRVLKAAVRGVDVETGEVPPEGPGGAPGAAMDETRPFSDDEPVPDMADVAGEPGPEGPWRDDLDEVYLTEDALGNRGRRDLLEAMVAEMDTRELSYSWAQRGRDPFDSEDTIRAGLVELVIQANPTATSVPDHKQPVPVDPDAPEGQQTLDAPAERKPRSKASGVHAQLAVLGVTKKPDQEAVILVATAGRTSHTSEMSETEVQVAYGLARQVEEGQMAMDEIRAQAEKFGG